MNKQIKIDCIIKEKRNNHYVKIEELKNCDVEKIYNVLHFKYLGKQTIIKNLVKRIKKVGDIAEEEIERILEIKK